MRASTYQWSYYPDFNSFSAVAFTISIIKLSQFPQAKIFSSNIAVAIADAHEAICQGNKGYAGKDVPVQEAICRWLFKQSWSY